jgi:hypothetical protein
MPQESKVLWERRAAYDARKSGHSSSHVLATRWTVYHQCYAEPPMYNHCNSNRQWWFETLNDNRTESTISRSVVWPKKFNKSHNSGHFLPQQNNIVEFWVLEPTHPQSNIHERFSWGINQYWMWTSLFIVFMPRIKTWEILIGRNHVQCIGYENGQHVQLLSYGSDISWNIRSYNICNQLNTVVYGTMFAGNIWNSCWPGALNLVRWFTFNNVPNQHESGKVRVYISPRAWCVELITSHIVTDGTLNKNESWGRPKSLPSYCSLIAEVAARGRKVSCPPNWTELWPHTYRVFQSYLQKKRRKNVRCLICATLYTNHGENKALIFYNGDYMFINIVSDSPGIYIYLIDFDVTEPDEG